MPPVFWNFHPDPHPYDDALAELRAAGDGEAAVAVNIMYDHRVSDPRADAFDKFVNKPCTAHDLREALIDYHEKKVQRRKLPHYVYAHLNGNNLLNGQAGVPPEINLDRRLVRALDLNGLWPVFVWAQVEGRAKYPKRWGRTFDTFPTTGGRGPVMDFLDEKMDRTSIEEFVPYVLDLLDVYGRLEKNPFQPTWATTWSAFKKYAAEGPDRWCQVLGMYKPWPCWIVLLKYTVREAGTVARPTQLDAGWYDSHFPSPRVTPKSEGGHPMDLSAAPAVLDEPPLPEYVHTTTHHTPAHWTSLAPYNCGRTTAQPLPPLPEQRLAHYERLQRHHNIADVRGWMDDPL